MDRNLFLYRFFGLVAAHFISDIPLNPAWLSRAKRKSSGIKQLGCLIGHCLIVTFVSYLFILGWRSRACIGIAAAVGACHFAVDYVRVRIEPVVYRDGVATIPKGRIISGRARGDWWQINRLRWWAVNIGDQVAHIVCIIAIVWLSS